MSDRHQSVPHRGHASARHAKRRGRRWPVAILLILALALAGTVGWSLLHGAEPSQAAECTGPATPLVLASSSDKSALLTSMAADFSATGSDAQGRCVDVEVLSVSSGKAELALAQGWDEELGPQPDVWSPTSSLWLPILERALVEGQRSSLIAAPDSVPSIASSVEVVGMPRPMAEALGWPEAQIGWRDLLDLTLDPGGWAGRGHPEWGPFVLGKTNPTLSQSGLDATIATYYAGAGGPSGAPKTTGLTVADVRSASTRRFVAGVEQSILRYGDNSVQYLTQWQRADQQGEALSYLSALVTQESALQSYNEGNPSGDPETVGDGPVPEVPLAAVYPAEGAAVVDHPYTILGGAWMTAPKVAAAEAFLDYLRSPAVQEIWQDNHFRTYDGKVAADAGEDVGVLPDQPARVLQNPSPAVVEEILASWDELRKTANVLSVVDVSGSMRETLPDSSTTKLAAAKAAVVDSLDLFTDRDELGLWSFSEGVDGQPDYRSRVPVGPMGALVGDRTRRRAMVTEVAALRGGGGTGLYNTIAAAYRAVLGRPGEGRIDAVVVLTDGRNDVAGGLGKSDLIDLVGAGVGGRTARIITIAYGPDADEETLAEIAEASRGAAYVAPTAEDLAKVYASALSNF